LVLLVAVLGDPLAVTTSQGTYRGVRGRKKRRKTQLFECKDAGTQTDFRVCFSACAMRTRQLDFSKPFILPRPFPKRETLPTLEQCAIRWLLVLVFSFVFAVLFCFVLFCFVLFFSFLSFFFALLRFFAGPRLLNASIDVGRLLFSQRLRSGNCSTRLAAASSNGLDSWRRISIRKCKHV